jgi:hypothetical protein
MARDALVVEPLTPRLWPAFEDLLDQGGPASRCWCMAWWVGPAWRRGAFERNRVDFREALAQWPPPGLVALRAGVAMGWVQTQTGARRHARSAGSDAVLRAARELV